MAGILFVGMLVLFILGVPIAAGIGMAAAGFLAFLTDLPLTVVPQRLFTTSDSFPLMAILRTVGSFDGVGRNLKTSDSSG